MIANCKIENGRVLLNDRQLAINFTSGNDWKKDLYLAIDISYPKFYKMDSLSKMSILAIHLIKRKVDLDKYGEDGLALVFANSGSSQHTDKKFLSSYIDKGNPSPSLFVYTLPNILIGELSILNKWHGENVFLISEKFDPDLYLEQINFYFSKGAKACLCGWVDHTEKEERCILFIVENNGGEITHEELTKLYNQ